MQRTVFSHLVFHRSGEYSTYIFAEKAVSLIEAQAAAGPSAPPMFMYLAFQNIHWPLEVWDAHERKKQVLVPLTSASILFRPLNPM